MATESSTLRDCRMKTIDKELISIELFKYTKIKNEKTDPKNMMKKRSWRVWIRRKLYQKRKCLKEKEMN